jgi:glutamate synthase (NADPH/NADH) large chain
MRPIQKNTGLPPQQGLYDPSLEHDACGVGFVVNIRGEKSHQMVRSGLEILVNLTHRGACGCDPLTGDGAGILTQIPHDLFAAKAAELGITLPPPGDYGVGTLFLPRQNDERRHCEQRFEAIVAEEGQVFLGWRDVPIDNSVLGRTARDVEPVIRQMFVARGPETPPDMLEWKLYVIRKRHAREIGESDLTQKKYCYVPSLS